MALQIAAVLAAVAVAQKFLDFPLVRRLVCNLASGTTNQVDDWVVRVLYGTPEAQIPAKLNETQRNYSNMSEKAKEVATAPVPLPEEMAAKIAGDEKLQELLNQG